ncbi:MAG: hypothetical protein ACK4K9_07135 [Bacteroidia bacterium]
MKFKLLVAGFLAILYTTKAQIPIKNLSDKLYLDYKIQTTLLLSQYTLHQKIKAQILAKSENIKTINPDSAWYRAEEIAIEVLQNILINNNAFTNSETTIIKDFISISCTDSFEIEKDNFFKDFGNTFTKIARLHGVAVAVVWFASEFAQIISIPVTAALGVPQYGAMLAASPLSFINLIVSIKAVSIQNQIRLNKAYEKRKNKQQAKKIIKNANKTFGIKNENSILHKVGSKSDSTTFISINKNNFMIDVGSFWRLNQHKAYFRNVKLFAKNQIKNDSVLLILNNKKLSKQMRVLFAIDYLCYYNPLDFDLLKRKVYKSVIVLPNDISNCIIENNTKAWVYKLCEIENFNLLEDVLKQCPEGLKVYDVFELFDNIVLKYWAKNMKNPGFKKFRNVVKGINKTYYQSLQKSDNLFSIQLIEALIKNCKLSK